MGVVEMIGPEDCHDTHVFKHMSLTVYIVYYESTDYLLLNKVICIVFTSNM